MLEQLIVRHGAPTLAGLKTGSLISVRMHTAQQLQRETERLTQALEPRGIRLCIIKHGNHHALVYLYREAKLAQCLICPNVAKLLGQCGYRELTIPGVLATLREKLALEEGFPHEIGLFLGYPLPDVKGFICHQGKNCLLCGCWKVYADVEQALREFARYKKCISIYSKLFQTGYPISKLTVAAKSA